MRKDHEKKMKEKSKRSKAGKLLSVFGILVLSLATVLSGVIAFSYIYARNHLDFSADEALFSASVGADNTRYYYNGAKEEGEEYQPVEFAANTVSVDRSWTPLSEISSSLKEGFLAVEDRKFYRHRGVDFARTGFALVNSVFHIRPTFGASTITQQVVKNISGDNEITVRRKWNEILRALELEKRHSKEEILELYLNIVPLGEHLVGVGAGAEGYFGKNASELTPSEAALLIGLANAPSKYNPYAHPQEAEKKRNTVLRSMQDFGLLTAEEQASESQKPLGVLRKRPGEKTVDSWFIETVNEDIVSDLGKKYGMSAIAARKLVSNGGLRIETTVAPDIQKLLDDYFSDDRHFPGQGKQGLAFSMCIVDAKTGNLVAIAGRQGKKEANRLYNYATSLHTPGSTLKPLALYAPLIDEKRIHYATVFDDYPIEYEGEKPYPSNSPNRYDGLMTVHDAIKFSKNTVAMRLLGVRGALQTYRTLSDGFAFESLVARRGSLTDMAPAPLALGQLTDGLSLRALTEAYGVFPREGIKIDGASYLRVIDQKGNVLLENTPKEKRIFRKESARIMNQMLSEVVAEGTARGITLAETVDTAGKTGTSGGDRDRLFVGYTPYYVAGIWCGYENSGKPIGKIAPNHLQIWDSVMKKVHQSVLNGKSDGEIESFSTEGLIRRPFCKDSGREPTEVCLLDRREGRVGYGWFEPDNYPEITCDRHEKIYLDVLTGDLATEETQDEALIAVGMVKRPKERVFDGVKTTDDDYMFTEKESIDHFLIGSEVQPLRAESKTKKKNKKRF